MQNFDSGGLPIARQGLLTGVCAASAITLLTAIPAASAAVTDVVDVIPNAASAETDQNSEPSLAVNPLNSNQLIVGTFGNGNPALFWASTNGGGAWSDFGTALGPGVFVGDKTLAWRQDGVAALAATLNVATTPPPPALPTGSISVFQGGATNFGSAVFTTPVAILLDQPWLRTGPSGQTYLAYNNIGNAAGQTASIRVSSTNGSTFSPQVTLETVSPAGGQDAPSVRQAVNGSTVYAAFTRWGTASKDPASGNLTFSSSQVVVTKSTNSGATFSAGTVAATPTGYFSNTDNSNMTLGQERVASDLAIAVDPNNANHVVVAYGDRTSSTGLQLKVVESTDGGATWALKFTTPSTVRSELPAISTPPMATSACSMQAMLLEGRTRMQMGPCRNTW
jgi:hypothetical protein